MAKTPTRTFDELKKDKEFAFKEPQSLNSIKGWFANVIHSWQNGTITKEEKDSLM